MNSPVDDPKKGWLSWYSRVLEETRSELPFGKKLQAIFRRSRCVHACLVEPCDRTNVCVLVANGLLVHASVNG